MFNILSIIYINIEIYGAGTAADRGCGEARGGAAALRLVGGA
jgi:hypothetical protein